MTQNAKLPATTRDGELQDANGTRAGEPISADRQAFWDREWREGVAALTEIERAPYDEPENYADTHGLGCGET